MCGTRLPRLWEGMQSSVPGENTGRALSGAEGCESREKDWGCLVWPRGCARLGMRHAYVAKSVYTHGQEGVHRWLAGLVRRVYSGPSQPVVRTFSVMIIP